MISRGALARAVGTPALEADFTPSGHFDMDGYIALHGFNVRRCKPWPAHIGGMIYELAACPFDVAHTSGSAAFTLVDGIPGFKCQHDGCSGKVIKDVFDRYPAPRNTTVLESTPPRVGDPRSSGPFNVSDEGVFSSKTDSDGTTIEIRVAARIDVIAETRDAGGKNWGRLLKWRDNESAGT